MSYKHIRNPGAPYMEMAAQAQVMKMKTTVKASKKMLSVSGSAQSLPSLKKAKKLGRSLSTVSNSSKESMEKQKQKEKKQKLKKKSTRNLYLTVGDTVVDKLDDPLDDRDTNVNSDEPFTEEISKDIALAVAMIVAEHEMLKRKYPGKYPEKRKSKITSSGTDLAGTTKELVKTRSSESLPPVGISPGTSEKVAEQGDNAVKPEKQTLPTVDANNNEKTPKLAPTPAVQPRKEGNPKGKSAPVPGAPKRRPATVSRYSRHKTPSPAPSVPSTMAPQPTFAAKTGIQPDVFKYLAKVQNYINQLGYQRVGEPKIVINARLSMKMQMFTAREIIQKGLPIKCLHAVVVAVNFTNCLSSVERFPIYFRSHVGGREYKHIVLGVYFQGHFGALGISRDSGLQDKAISYGKLADLIFEFAKCYGQSGHILNEIKFGNVITHEQYSLENLFSKKYVVPIAGCHHNDIERNVEKFSKQLRAEMGTSSIKPPRADAFPSVPNIQNSRLSRSKTSVNLTNASRMSVRSRALSVGAGASSFANSKKIDDSPKKLTITQSKPGKTGRPNK